MSQYVKERFLYYSSCSVSARQRRNATMATVSTCEIHKSQFANKKIDKKKNQQPSISRKLLIFIVDQPGLEPGTSRL